MHCVFNKIILWPLVLFILVLLAGCKTDYQNLPAFSERKQLQVVVLTSAGSNHPQVYDPKKKTFAPAQAAGFPAQVSFLPFPGNFGFIPSTAYKATDATEGQPLNALIIAERQETGTVQEVIPIATILLEVADETTPIVIAVPARPSAQIIGATDFADFTQNYPVAKEILQKWFSYFKPHQKVQFIQWKDEKETEQLIRRWLI